MTRHDRATAPSRGLFFTLAACGALIVSISCGDGPSSTAPTKECEPGVTRCAGAEVETCEETGLWSDEVLLCDSSSGERCFEGSCMSACEVAARSDSYLGCEYWPTVTTNSVRSDKFDFAVVVGNSQATPVEVRVSLADQSVEEITVPAGEAATILLPWISELSPPHLSLDHESVLARAGAYRLESTMPVSAYQFSPLEYQSGIFGSYSNDASLLLPTSALTTEYLAVSRPTITHQGQASPGFVSIVATKDNTTVTVNSSSYTLPGPSLPALAPGDSMPVSMNRGDVLQLLSATDPAPVECDEIFGGTCLSRRDYDLTGSLVTADKPVAVFSGHRCSFVPYNKPACDHLEEQIYPLVSWSNHLVLVPTEPASGNEPNVWKVISGSSNNTIEFSPPLHPPVTLEQGEYVEFETREPLEVQGTGRVVVAQFMIGENYTPSAEMGDPSMGLVAPTDQYRNAYNFVVPDTYVKSFVTVIAPTDARVNLDDMVIPTLTPIGSSGFSYSRFEVVPGAHRMTSDGENFGLTVYGLAPNTSYLYAGGLDVKQIIID